MLDKLKGNKNNSKDSPPDLRKPDEKESADVGGKIKDLVGKMSGKNGEKKEAAESGRGPKKMPRPMPKPKIKPKAESKPKLKPKAAPKRSGGSSSGLAAGGFGRRAHGYSSAISDGELAALLVLSKLKVKIGVGVNK